MTEGPASTAKVIVITACDAAHFDLADDLFESVIASRTLGYTLGFVHIGPAGRPRPELRPEIIQAEAIDADVEREVKGYRVAYLGVKASLPTLFPGYDVYIWMDADCWVQNEAWYGALVDGAFRADLCAHPEYDIHYLAHQTPNDRTIEIYNNLFGMEKAKATLCYPMVNGGVFSARVNSPVWDKWSEIMTSMRRVDAVSPERHVYFSDQIPLHYLIHSRQFSFYPLRAIYNWQTYAALPRFDAEARCLTVPSPPFEVISVVHLAWTMKTQTFRIPAVALDATTLRYRDLRAFLGNTVPAP